MSSSLERAALDALDQAIIVVDAAAPLSVQLANATAHDYGLITTEGALAPPVESMVATQQALRRKSSRVSLPTPSTSFWLDDFRWFGRARVLEPSRELLTCVRARLRGRQLVAAFRERFRLSERQTDVLGQILRAHTNAEAAQALGISEATVRGHMGDLLAALGIDHKLKVYRLAEEIAYGDRAKASRDAHGEEAWSEPKNVWRDEDS